MPPRGRPATTPEASENQMISAAVDLARQQLEAGTASAQVITHYLKLGTTRERLEQERLRKEIALIEAKVDSQASIGRQEELYDNALKAMRSYQGNSETIDE